MHASNNCVLHCPRPRRIFIQIMWLSNLPGTCDFHRKTNKFSLENRKKYSSPAQHEEQIIELISYVHHIL